MMRLSECEMIEHTGRGQGGTWAGGCLRELVKVFARFESVTWIFERALRQPAKRERNKQICRPVALS
jgi:hypothetical protein